MIGFMQTIINLVISVYRWFICWEILFDYQGGIVTRLGRYDRPATCGWNWKIPFGIEELLITNVVPTTADLPPQAIVTTDGYSVLVETVILWGVSNCRKFILDVESGVTVLCEAGSASIYDVISSKSWKELQTLDIDELMTSVIRAKSKKWGVRIYSVQITSMSKLGLKEGCLRIANPSVLTAA